MTCGVSALTMVALRVGAWIETSILALRPLYSRVALRVGAWIETDTYKRINWLLVVALRVGAWIETIAKGLQLGCSLRRTPCGCVD